MYALFFSTALIQAENQSVGFLAFTQVDALCAVELPEDEFLLIFSTLGIYVDGYGRKTREVELMFPTLPLAVGKYLLSLGFFNLLSSTGASVSW